MIALISGIVMGVVGVIFARGALEIMGTPDDVIGLSTIYMRILFFAVCRFLCFITMARQFCVLSAIQRDLLSF